MKCNQISAVLGCRLDTAGNPLGPVLIHTEYRTNASGQAYVYATRYTDAANIPITLGAGESVKPGLCTPTVGTVWPLGANYASGTLTAAYDPDSNGPTWVGNTFGYVQSVTVTVLKADSTPSGANRVRVNFPGAGAAQRLFLTQGETKTWSVAQDSSNIAEALSAMSIEAEGNSAFNVVWTQQ